MTLAWIGDFAGDMAVILVIDAECTVHILCLYGDTVRLYAARAPRKVCGDNVRLHCLLVAVLELPAAGRPGARIM